MSKQHFTGWVIKGHAMKKPILQTKLIIGLFSLVCVLDANAKPLKNLLMVFSSTPPVNISEGSSKYLNIRGIRWDYRQMQTPHLPYFQNTGHLKIARIGRSDIELRGKDNYVESVFVISRNPSKQFKKILEAELGRGVVNELKGCRSSAISTAKSYQINFRNRAPIYVDADAVLSFEPTMSPLQTSFDFYLERPKNWKCSLLK